MKAQSSGKKLFILTRVSSTYLGLMVDEWCEGNGTQSCIQRINLLPTVKHGGSSVLVWGCMSASGVGNLTIINGIMNHKVYMDILRNNLQSSAAKMGLQHDYIFMHDNDSKYMPLDTI